MSEPSSAAICSNTAPDQRLHFLDASRGIAIVLVLLSHFGDVFPFYADSRVPDLLRGVGLLATPTFVLINGALMGFLITTRKREFARLQRRYCRRGLMLLTIGHLLMTSGHIVEVGSVPPYLFITDVVGICMIVQPWLIRRLTWPWRLSAAMLLYVSSCSVVGFARFDSVIGWFQETLVGTTPSHFYRYAFPLVPWFSLDLAATVLGERIGPRHSTDRSGVSRAIMFTGAAAIAAGAALWFVFTGFGLSHSGRFASHFLGVHKSPPSPLYLLVFGGMGLTIVIGGTCLAEQRWSRLWPFAGLAALGQSSLAAFLVQNWLYYTVVYALRGHLPSATWPIVLVATIVICITATMTIRRKGWDGWMSGGRERCDAHQSRSDFSERTDERKLFTAFCERKAS